MIASSPTSPSSVGDIGAAERLALSPSPGVAMPKAIETPAKVTTKKVKTPPAVVEKVEREIAYPEVTVVVCQGDGATGAITTELAKEYLGWEEETEDIKFGSDFLFTDLTGKKIRCINNTRNRPLDERWAMTIAQEHLNKKWEFNGETVVIGKTGEVMSGQHRLIGLILAEQIRQMNPELWTENWPNEVTMDTIVVFGIDESDKVANSSDQNKVRSLSDVFFRSELFSKYEPKKRKVIAKATDYAVKLLWNRTGAKDDAYAPIRTHAEAMDFLERHPSLIDKCVVHVLEENHENSVTSILPLGSAAGVCYLMASSKSDPAAYKESRSEQSLDMSMLDKAQKFFRLLSPQTKDFNAIRDAISGLNNPDTGETGGTFAEKLAIVVKAWTRFANDEPVTPASVKLRYLQSSEDGSRILDERSLNFGGIDLGDDKAPDVAPAETEATVQEVAKAAKKIREDKGESVADAKAELLEQLDDLRKANPGHVLFFEIKDQYRLYGADAEAAVKHLGVKLYPRETVAGIQTVSFKKSNLVPSHKAFNEAGLRIATVTQVDGEPKVTRMAPIVKPKRK